MAKRLIGTGTTDNNGTATIQYTGTGAGKIDIVAEYTDGESIIQSEIYEVLDTIAYETELTSSKSYNIALNDIDFYLEFTVCPPTNSATSYIQIGNSSVNWNIGDLFANANCGTMVNNTFYGKVIPTETDTKVTVRRIGTNVTLTVGDSTYNITGMNITCSTLKVVAITNGGVIKDFKIYPI